MKLLLNKTKQAYITGQVRDRCFSQSFLKFAEIILKFDMREARCKAKL